MDIDTIESAYYKMAHTLNTESTYNEIVKSIINALKSLLQFMNTDIPTNNYMVYNILLVTKLFVRTNEEKYYYLDSFRTLKTLLMILSIHQNKVENVPKR